MGASKVARRRKVVLSILLVALSLGVSSCSSTTISGTPERTGEAEPSPSSSAVADPIGPWDGLPTETAVGADEYPPDRPEGWGEANIYGGFGPDIYGQFETPCAYLGANDVLIRLLGSPVLDENYPGWADDGTAFHCAWQYQSGGSTAYRSFGIVVFEGPGDECSVDVVGPWGRPGFVAPNICQFSNEGAIVTNAWTESYWIQIVFGLIEFPTSWSAREMFEAEYTIASALATGDERVGLLFQ
jgi:hypothetical protein